MAAVTFPVRQPWAATGGDRHLRLVRGASAARPARPDARVYRRRRAVALLTVAALALGVATVARMALAGPGGGALTSSPSAGATYVVQPGDTLWSIVVAHSRGGDPRPEVAQLALELNGQPLQPGQRLQIP